MLPREEHGWLEQSSMGDHARAPAAAPARQRPPRPPAAALPDDPSPRRRRLHERPRQGHDRRRPLARASAPRTSATDRWASTPSATWSWTPTWTRASAPAIASLRNRLLAEHLDCDPQAVADALAARGSLIAAVESLRGRARSLAPLPAPAGGRARRRPPDATAKAAVDLAFLDGLACDPEQPAPDELLAMLVPEGLRRPVRRSLVGWGLVDRGAAGARRRSGG